MIDLYCERLGPGLLAEPLNAFTNLAFLIAAWLAFRAARRQPAPGAWILVLLLASIGIGSGLFHTFATRWAMLLDVIPILLFQVAFLGLYARCVMRMSLALSITAVATFVAVAQAAGSSSALNGSLGYAPALLVMLGLGVYQAGRRDLTGFERGQLLLAAALFAVSFTLRTIDPLVCARFPIGTHFLWHLINALVLYLVMRAYLVAVPRGS